MKNADLRRLALIYVVLFSVVMTTDAEPTSDLPAAYFDILSLRGVPEASEDWSFAPFSDRGAWQGFALPPTDRLDLRGGVSGPFLMPEGRWLAPRLVGLELRDAASGEPLRWEDADDYRSNVHPGSLRQTATLDGLTVSMDLWFDSSQMAILQVRLLNRGDSARELQLAWTGGVFPDASLEVVKGGVVATSSSGAVVRVQADRTTRPAVIESVGEDRDRYRLQIAETLRLDAGGRASLAVAMTMTMSGDLRPDSTSIADVLTSADASRQRSLARWNGYLRSIDRGRHASDPVQILAVKSLMTLVNNWRAPAGRMRYSALFPSSNIHYFNGFWAWDSWKHAVALVTFDYELAKDQVRAMFDHQDETGMIADVVYQDASEDNWRDTKPPLAGWAIRTIYEATGDLDFVRELYPKLTAYHRFWYSHRDHDGDRLCEYGSTDGTLVAARWESGMDNAVRFDESQMLQNGPTAWSMDQESVDLNSYLFKEKLALASLASALGDEKEADRWTTEAESLRRQIQSVMFDEASGWFYDVRIDSGAIVPVQGPEGWIPLWTGVATAEQAARVRETMLSLEKFRTHVPFPTVARDDPGFSDGYWRGLVWLDQAHFAIDGLRRYGYSEDARALRDQLFANLEGAMIAGQPLRENYHPLTGEGRNVRHFSWTAAHLLLLTLWLPVEAPEELATARDGIISRTVSSAIAR